MDKKEIRELQKLEETLQRRFRLHDEVQKADELRYQIMKKHVEEMPTKKYFKVVKEKNPYGKQVLSIYTTSKGKWIFQESISTTTRCETFNNRLSKYLIMGYTLRRP